MAIRPLHNNVLVARLEAESKTAGGIIIPDTAKEKPQKGKVIAVGSGVRNEKGDLVPLELKVGNVVIFTKWGGTEINVNGQDMLLLKESDVLAVEE